ncbi:MAG: hypothetical protein ACOY9J_03505 [Pseudomonadota bacterium]
MSAYDRILMAACTVEGVEVGNAIAVLIGHRGAGPAFGGEFPIALRPIGSQGPATHYGTYSLARAEWQPLIDEFNSAGPYPLMTGRGVQAGQISAGKAAVTVACLPRATHENGFPDFVQSLGLEIIQ